MSEVNEPQMQPQPVQPSYEELARMYNELNQNRAYEEARTRLAFCIEIMKLRKEFPEPYIEGIAKEIMTILPIDGLNPEKLMEKKTTKTTKKAKKEEE